MKILAVDAATEACSAALLRDGALVERYEVIGRGHAGRLLPMADELLNEAGISIGRAGCRRVRARSGRIHRASHRCGHRAGTRSRKQSPGIARQQSGGGRGGCCPRVRQRARPRLHGCAHGTGVLGGLRLFRRSAGRGHRRATRGSCVGRSAGRCVMVRGRSRLVRISRDRRAPGRATFRLRRRDSAARVRHRANRGRRTVRGKGARRGARFAGLSPKRRRPQALTPAVS